MRSAAAVLTAVLLSAACIGGLGPTAQPRNGSSPTPGTASAATPSSPTSSPPAARLSGMLPVEQFGPTGADPSVAGFLDLSAGTFTRDLRADMVQAGAWQLLKTSATPHLYGSSSALYGQITYDAQLGRWLPVARSQVSADGLSYAYAEWFSAPPTPCPHGCIPVPTGGRIHVTDIRSGQDKVVYTFNGEPAYQVVSFSGQDVYLSTECWSGGSGCDELWRLDVQSGRLSRIGEAGRWWLVDGGYVWMVTLGNGEIAPIHLLRIDLATGNTETWITLPAFSATNPFLPDMLLMGLDAGGFPLVILDSRSPTPLLRLVAPDQTNQIFSADGPYSASVTDDKGTWFGVVDNTSPSPTKLGLYLYTKQLGVQSISSLHLLPV